MIAETTITPIPTAMMFPPSVFTDFMQSVREISLLFGSV
jgi:hypothetical protein